MKEQVTNVRKIIYNTIYTVYLDSNISQKRQNDVKKILVDCKVYNENTQSCKFY